MTDKTPKPTVIEPVTETRGSRASKNQIKMKGDRSRPFTRDVFLRDLEKASNRKTPKR